MSCPTGTDIALAADKIRRGQLVAFATETVYGLGANAFDKRAVARIFEAKQRPTFDPLIVHLADPKQLFRVVAGDLPESVQPLIERFWPGPLTLVLPKSDRIPDLVTAGLESVAVRVPAHPMALELLRSADVPIAAPSANRFGCVSPTTAEHVAEQLSDRIDYLLDGGPCQIGLESTILNVAGKSPEVLRLGGLSLEEIESVIGPVEIRIGTSDPGHRSRKIAPQIAPGMLERHYAPRTPLVVRDTISESDVQSGDALLLRSPPAFSVAHLESEILSETGDLKECASNFFSALRRLDSSNPRRILAQSFPAEGLGRALNDRLQRASVKADDEV